MIKPNYRQMKRDEMQTALTKSWVDIGDVGAGATTASLYDKTAANSRRLTSSSL